MIAEANIAAGPKGLDALRRAIKQRFAAGSVRVPIMPKVASKMMALMGNPDVDLSDLSDLVHRDGSLAVRVLKVANSAAFGGGQEILSLQEAVQRLGLSCLRETILSASLRAGIFHVPGFEREVNQLWRHALCSAFFAKEIARSRCGREDLLFICGLLHAIGKPVLLQLIADLAKQYQSATTAETIEPLLDELHWESSTAIARQWNLPQPVQTTCAHYRNYASAPAFRDETASTYLADLLASWVTWPGKVDEQTLKQDPVLEALNLAFDDIQRFKETVELQVAAIEQ